MNAIRGIAFSQHVRGLRGDAQNEVEIYIRYNLMATDLRREAELLDIRRREIEAGGYFR